MADIAQFRVNNTDYNVADDTKVPYDLFTDTVGFTSKNFFDESLIQVGIAWNGNANADRARAIIPCQPSTKYILTMNGTNNLDSLGFKLPSGSYTTITFPQTITTGANDSIITFGFNKTAIALSNITALKLMLRKADIMDDTYEPYNPSVKQILRNNKIIEGKNLLPYPYAETSKTASGVTFTDNGDGSISMSGTAGSNGAGISLNSALDLPSGKYIISWEWSGTVSASKVSLRIGHKDNTWWNECNTVGQNSVELTIDDSITNNSAITVMINLSANITVTNLKVKPMIRKATETDPTYESYYIPGVVSQEAQNVLGAKNLLEYPYFQTTQTVNGVTFTDNGDGTITVNGTATANAEFRFMFDKNVILAGNYILSLNQLIDTSIIEVYIQSSLNKVYQDTLFSTNRFNPAWEYPFSLDYNGYDGIRVCLVVKNGKTVSNLTFKPMIRPASIRDNTYVFPAKTNRMLTEKIHELLGDSGIIKVLNNTFDLNDLLEYPSGIYYFTTTPTNAPENATYSALLNIVRNHTSDAKQIIIRGNAIYIRSYGGDPAHWDIWYRFTGTATS